MLNLKTIYWIGVIFLHKAEPAYVSVLLKMIRIWIKTLEPSKLAAFVFCLLPGAVLKDDWGPHLETPDLFSLA